MPVGPRPSDVRFLVSRSRPVSARDVLLFLRLGLHAGTTFLPRLLAGAESDALLDDKVDVVASVCIAHAEVCIINDGKDARP